MRRFVFFLTTVALFTLSSLMSITTDAREKGDQKQLDSATIRLVERLEHGSWSFIPSSFTGSNNIFADFNDTQDNRIVVSDDTFLINLDFFGARITSGASTPLQRGRAVATAAAAAHLNGSLPNHINSVGEITERNASVDKKGRNITLEIRYIIEGSNVSLASPSTSASFRINTSTLMSTVIFNNMNLEGTLEGRIILP